MVDFRQSFPKSFGLWFSIETNLQALKVSHYVLSGFRDRGPKLYVFYNQIDSFHNTLPPPKVIAA